MDLVKGEPLEAFDRSIDVHVSRIRMAVELMKQNADPKHRRELEQNIAELDALIEEILLVSRLDSVEAIDALEDVDLLALAAGECARCEDVELHGEQISLRGDARLLRRMIRNLLANAERHGAPPIEVVVRSTGTGAEISIRDHGAGSPAGDRERVFDTFFRRTGATQGSGLDLALVRQIAKRHGGAARCTAPQEGRGSLFSVSLIR